MTDLTRSLRVIGVAGLSALALPASASADTNTIAACVSREGRVRIVRQSDRSEVRDRPEGSVCHRGERLVTWSIVGPVGPQGPAGPGFAGVQYFTVGNGDLRPVGGGLFGTSFGPPPGGTFSTAAAPLLAGIHLPQDAQVLAIRANVFDNSASDLTIEVIEQDLSTGNALLIASVASAGAAGAPSAIDVTLAIPHTIDNARFHYFVRVSPTTSWTATSLQVLGVTVAYTLLPVPGS